MHADASDHAVATKNSQRNYHGVAGKVADLRKETELGKWGLVFENVRKDLLVNCSMEHMHSSVIGGGSHERKPP
jgi:hypothetical protein